MANTSMGLGIWRDYFRSANSDIFSIIEHAILVAVSDCPYDFKLKRDRIAEMLFTCKITKCYGCDSIELAVPKNDSVGKIDDDDDDDKYKSGIIEAGGSKDTKESKMNSSRDYYNNGGGDDDDDDRKIIEINVNNNHVRDDSYGDAEVLTDEIEESQFCEEVLRIREIIDNWDNELDDVLFDSLRQLQLMRLTVETLTTTEIGKSVNALRKHGSNEIRNLVRTLIDNWKIMVDEWVKSTTVIAGAEVATESVKTSAVEEEDGVFLATPVFFYGMDDGENLQNCGEFNKNRENGRKRGPEKTDIPKRDFRAPDDPNTPLIKKNQESMLKNEASLCKPNRALKTECRPVRSNPPSCENGTTKPKPVTQLKVKNEITVQREKLNRNHEASVQTKLEAAKRKLQERYQEAENAKKQRTIQVVELHDLPKQSLAQRNQQTRAGNQHRQRANGRR